jgi:hypothetical protein
LLVSDAHAHALGLWLRRGVTNVPQIRRGYAAHLDEALPLILAAQT